MRSTQNYAHLLAKARGLNLTDVTCSGATTQHILESGQFFQPPQVDALRPNTELVTITVGGNDVSYLGNLVAWSSQQDPDRIPFVGRLLARTATPEAEVDRALAILPDRLARIATEVRQRSPRAILVFVDYTTVGWPPSLMPIFSKDQPAMNIVMSFSPARGSGSVAKTRSRGEMSEAIRERKGASLHSCSCC
jgi:hypothetical protein